METTGKGEEMKFASHAWFTRYYFPNGGDSAVNNYIVHFERPGNVPEMIEKMVPILLDFYKELGSNQGRIGGPLPLEVGRFVLEGPKGFSIVEIAPAFTQEEFDALNDSEEIHLDENVWGGVFSGKLSKEGK